MPPDLPEPGLPEIDTLLGQVNDLTARYKSGSPDSLRAWKELAVLLLRVTVAREPFGLQLHYGAGGRTQASLGGVGTDPTAAIPLRDGRFLRMTMRVGLVGEKRQRPGMEEVRPVRRLKVLASAFQYQADPEGRDWIFRFDYLRLDLLRRRWIATPGDPHSITI